MVQQEYLGPENEHGPSSQSSRADAAISNIIVINVYRTAVNVSPIE